MAIPQTPVREHRTGRACDPDLDLFAQADWNLATSPRRVTDVHPYPARFILELPALALDVLRPDGPVIDPFCGSGTTLVEALRRGHEAIGIDLNPIACLISRVKTRPWLSSDEDHLECHITGVLESAATDDSKGLTNLDIPRVDHWFEPWAQRLMAGAVRYLRDLDPADPWHDRVALAISAATVRISRQDSDTRYAAVAKQTGPDGGLAALRDSLLRIAEWSRANAIGFGSTEATVHCIDSRAMTPVRAGAAAAAIFSPPYPNAYEYWLYHKYRMYWLGFDPIAVREAEIGARPHYCKPNGLDESDFRQQMTDVFVELHRVLQPGGAALVVIGDSQIRGRAVDNADVLNAAATDAGFQPLASAFRLIRKSSTSFNQRHSRARLGEHVLLYQRKD